MARYRLGFAAVLAGAFIASVALVGWGQDAFEAPANNAPASNAPDGNAPVDADPDPQALAAISRIQQHYGDDYRTHVDPMRKLVLASNHLPTAVLEYLAKRLGRYADAQAQSLFTNRLTQYVSLVFPDKATFAKLRPNEHTGGWYQSYNRTLVAANLAYTLTHEFTHALSEGDQAARGVRGLAYWFHEGVAACFEDSVVLGTARRAPDSDGGNEADDDADRGYRVVPVTNPRVNVLRRGLRGLKLEKMLGTNTADFQADWNINYAAAGYLCRYLHDNGKLDSFYAAWCDTVDDDPSGVGALLATFEEEELSDVEKAFKKWVKALGKAQPSNYQPPGVPAFGVRGREVPAGLRVTKVRSPASRAGIERGDVLLEVAGLAVNNQAKLNEALARNRRRRTFRVVLWRGDEVLTVTVGR